MNGRERRSDLYDPRPAYPPPPAARELPDTAEPAGPAMHHRKEPSSMGKFYVIMCLIAFGLLLISGILGGAFRYLEEPEEEDYQDEEGSWGENQEERDANQKAYEDAGESYDDSQRNLGASRALFMDCGVVVLTFGLVIGAVTDRTLSKRTKLGMLIAAGIIIAFTLGSPGQVTNYFWGM